MKIHVRYFAVVRERVRRETEELELPTGATAAAALDALGERHESVRALRRWIRVAVNQEAVAETRFTNNIVTTLLARKLGLPSSVGG